MTPTGELFIGQSRARTGETSTAHDPSRGQAIEPAFSAAGAAAVERACIRVTAL